MLGSVFVNYERQMICIHVKTRTARATTTRPTLNHPSTIADATATTSNAANESAGAGTTMTSMPLLMLCYRCLWQLSGGCEWQRCGSSAGSEDVEFGFGALLDRSKWVKDKRMEQLQA